MIGNTKLGEIDCAVLWRRKILLFQHKTSVVIIGGCGFAVRARYAVMERSYSKDWVFHCWSYDWLLPLIITSNCFCFFHKLLFSICSQMFIVQPWRSGAHMLYYLCPNGRLRSAKERTEEAFLSKLVLQLNFRGLSFMLTECSVVWASCESLFQGAVKFWWSHNQRITWSLAWKAFQILGHLKHLLTFRDAWRVAVGNFT